MNSQHSLTLYHVTNRASAERMLRTGIGLDLGDYADICDQVRDYFNVPLELLTEVLPAARPETQGLVWFYQELPTALKYLKLGTTGGFYKGDYIERLVRACAKFINLPFTQLQSVVETLTGGLSEPVVVVVELEASEVVKPNKHGVSSEVCVLKKVPASAILKVLSGF